MSIASILIGLQASQRAKGVTTASFLTPLAIQPGEVAAARADSGTSASGMVDIAIVRYSDFAHVDTSTDTGAQSEAFFAGIMEGFQVAARFLDKREPTVTAAMRAKANLGDDTQTHFHTTHHLYGKET